MMNIITYQSTNPHDVDYTWLAYIILPNGQFWNVRFNGATEDIARSRVAKLWEKESNKVLARLQANPMPTDDHLFIKSAEPSSDSAQDEKRTSELGRGAHFIGKIWMRHPTEGSKRVALTEITMYEGRGYVRGR
jgi:hypothetical protein